MEAASAASELDREDLRNAELAFQRYLRCNHMSERFIATYGEDLFAQAQKEYATWVAAGNVARSPVGWLITCGWRRALDQLKKESKQPQQISIEALYHLPDASTPGPEQRALDQDRSERLQWAMSFLPQEDRRLLELTYFEGFDDVFAAGREMGWTKSKAHHHHRSALKRLKAILPEDRGLLGAEIGLAAWVSLISEAGTSWSPAGGIEAGPAPGALHEGVAALTHRFTDLWRRLSPATDPSNAGALSGAARVAGACAGAAAVACFASGAIGPGVGAIDLSAHQHHRVPKAAAASRPAPAPSPAPVAAPSSPESSEPKHVAAEAPQQRSTQSKHKASTPTAESTSTPVREATGQQAREEFGVEAGGGSTPSAPPTTSSPPSGGGSSRVSGGHSAAPAPHSSSSSTSAEFGL